mmetsp:Transcript_23491/g.34812  ORF Transcript_23491/g.34812 Transcript_23491/m.34812 type:complete len:82 (+) Transcript_23491:848-1093(+)
MTVESTSKHTASAVAKAFIAEAILFPSNFSLEKWAMISDPDVEKHLLANEFIVILNGLKVFVDRLAFLARRPAEVKALCIV